MNPQKLRQEDLDELQKFGVSLDEFKKIVVISQDLTLEVLEQLEGEDFFNTLQNQEPEDIEKLFGSL